MLTYVSIPFPHSTNEPAEGRDVIMVMTGICREVSDIVDPVNESIVADGFLDFVVNKASEGDDAMAVRAVRSFAGTLHSLGASEPTADELRLWVADMMRKGVAPASRRRYFGKIHAMFLEFRSETTPDADPFVEARAALDVDAASPQAGADDWKAVHRVVRHLGKYADAPRALRIFLYMLYNAGATLRDVAELRFDTYSHTCEQADEIVDSMCSSPNRKYVFPLGQRQKRQPQIVRELVAELGSALKIFGLAPVGGFTEDYVRALWIDFAVHTGIALPDIAAVVGKVPAERPYLALVRPTRLAEREKCDIICHVANTINNVASRWHVMKLRKGVGPNDIKTNLDAAAPALLEGIQFYYPTFVSAKKEGKRMRFEEKPYIPELLFFKTRQDKVGEIFRHIGDKAWCFRTVNTPDAPYSVIPNVEMARFQHFIGQFSPDMNLRLSTGADLGIGRRVRVTGGLMAGYEGEIYDVPGTDDDRIFTLRLSSAGALTWIARVPAPLLTPLP